MQTVRGFNGRNYRLVTDRATGLPLRISNEYNPTTISEQTVEVAYNYPTAASEAAIPATEEELISLYPGEFEKFRENNYRIENLRSLPLPGFSLPTTTAERYTRAKGDSFKAPTLIAIIDPGPSRPGRPSATCARRWRRCPVRLTSSWLSPAQTPTWWRR